MLGQGGDRLRRDGGVSLGLGDDEKERLGGRFDQRYGFRYRPQVGWRGAHGYYDQIGEGQDRLALLRNCGGRIDEAIRRGFLLEHLQALGEAGGGDGRTLRRFAFSPLVPEAQSRLFIGVDEPGRTVASALNLDSQVGGEGGLSTPT